MEAGSSYLPSELNAAYLWAQLLKADEIYNDRMRSWRRYYEELEELEAAGYIELPHVPNDCRHNAHMFYIKAKDLEEWTKLISYLKGNGVMAVFHYIPLHTAPAGKNMVSSGGRTSILRRRVNVWQGCRFIMVSVNRISQK